MKPETMPCRSMFSNGTEYEWFLETQCENCCRFRNGKCRIFRACEEARFDNSRFPYDELLDFKGGYGGKVCKRFTDQPITRKRCYKPPSGQMELTEAEFSGGTE